MDDWLILIMLPFCVATLSITTARSKIGKPLREWLEPRSPLLAALTGCPYCLAHWYAILTTAIVASAWLEFALVWLTTIALATIIMGLMQKLNLMQDTEIELLRGHIKKLNEKYRNEQQK